MVLFCPDGELAQMLKGAEQILLLLILNGGGGLLRSGFPPLCLHNGRLIRGLRVILIEIADDGGGIHVGILPLAAFLFDAFIFRAAFFNDLSRDGGNLLRGLFHFREQPEQRNAEQQHQVGNQQHHADDIRHDL